MATTHPCIDKPAQCDRETAFVLFNAVQGKVSGALLEIQDAINRSRSLKRYPYAMFYRKILVSSETGSPATNTPWAAGSAEMNKIKNTIYERASDTLANIKFEYEATNLDLVRMIVDSCLRYQIAVRNLVSLARYLSESLDRFNKTHLLYDDMLKKLQKMPDKSILGANQSESTSAVLPTMEQMVDVQNNLEITKETLQKFLNQVPSQLASLRIEIDLMNIYDNVDDTVKLHRFFGNQYIKSLMQQTASPTLRGAYQRICHSWNELLLKQKIGSHSS